MTHDHRVHAEVLETYFCGAGQIFDKDVQKARETKPTNMRPPSAFPVRGGIWPPAGEGQEKASDRRIFQSGRARCRFCLLVCFVLLFLLAFLFLLFLLAFLFFYLFFLLAFLFLLFFVC